MPSPLSGRTWKASSVRIGYLDLAHYSNDMLVLLAPFSPTIEPDGERAAYFDADGMDRLFGPLPHYGRTILTAAGGGAADEAARLGFGPGKWFAWAAARRAEPGAMAMVVPDGTSAFAADLPFDWLPLSAKAVATLAALGVRTVGQFAALPRQTLAPRFGREAVLAHQIAQGEDPRPLRPSLITPTCAATRRCDPPLQDATALFAVTARLLTALCRQVQAGHGAYRTLRLTLGCEDGQWVSAERHLALPATTAEAATVVLRDVLQELAHAPVAAVTVRLSGLEQVVGHQLSLLPDETVQRQRRQQVERATGELLRRYPGRLGRLTAAMPHAPLPEDRWRFAVARPAEPVRLARRGHRRVVQIGDRWETVTTARRVWQVDLWWPEERQRRYVQIATQTGRHLTVYYDSVEHGWFLAERLD